VSAVRPSAIVAARVVWRARDFSATRGGVAAVFLVALALWWLEALVMPFAAGRDIGTYLGAYVELFQRHPIDLGYVLDRTPLATLPVGGLLNLAGGALAEPVISLLFAGAVTAWFLAARAFGDQAALLTLAVLLTWPGFAILFHELSSDTLFAAAFAGWSLLVIRVLASPTPARIALLGAGVGLLALVRPGNQVLLVLGAVPLMLSLPWRTRLLSAVAFVVPAAAILAGWAVHNGLRFGDYTVARGGDATVPFYRTFVTDRIVRPDNGPASRELGRAVQRDLLPEEPYRSYGITLDEFFTKASPRMQVDLLALADRIKGWDTDHRWLRDVGVEAVRTHPLDYARGVGTTTWQLLTHALYRPLPASEPSTGGEATSEGATVAVGGQTLPEPTEGEPIPAPHEGGVTTPDGSIYTVWTSPTEHHLVFVHPGDRARYDALHRRMDELGSRLADEPGDEDVLLRLNQLSRWYPPPVLWLALGLIGLVVRRPARALALSTPALAAAAVILLSALGLPAEPHYVLPVAPAFVVLAAGALLGPRAPS
jgi:hypothetical protein